MSPAPGSLVGVSVPRKEDGPLLTGRARFVDDLARPGCLHAHVVRSPYAHARVNGIDAAAALAAPGVHAVLTAADLPEDVRIPMRMFTRPGMEQYLQPPLARDLVRYAGEPVALIVADSRYAAEDAAELVDVDYDLLDAVVDPEEAAAPGAPLLHPGTASNVPGTLTIEKGDVDAAFAAAHLVVEETMRVGRHAAVPMETRGLLAEVDAWTGQIVLYGASKIVHVNHRILARLLGRPEESVRLVEPSVGGGFGARGEFYPEDFLVPFAALRLGRPVTWTEDREEHLKATNHSREQVHHIAVALDAGGRFLALRDRFLNNAGGYVRTHGLVVPGMTAALLPGPYDWPAYRCELNQVLTNKTPAGTYRAPGRYEANFARERVIDLAAGRLGIDPVELRRRNLVRSSQMPYATGTHTDGHPVVYDSGDYELLLDKTLERARIGELREWRAADAGPGRRRGLGVGLFIEKSGIARWEYARVSLTSEGRTLVHSGGASVGQGLDTTLAQVCADALGVDFDDIDVRHGDTREVPDGMGAFGSRLGTLGTAAVLDGAGKLRDRILDTAARELEIDAGDLEIRGDRVVARGAATHAIGLAELFDRARPLHALAAGAEPFLSEEGFFRSEDMTFPYGVHVAAIEIDLETGGVDVHRYVVGYDIGRQINPQLVEGQIVGGAAQGVGGALFEELVYDEGGALLAGSFMDYLLPTAGEAPPVDVLVTEDAPTPRNPLGAKGAGEGGTAAAGAAIANAVADALGANVTRIPLSPDRIVRLARKGDTA